MIEFGQLAQDKLSLHDSQIETLSKHYKVQEIVDAAFAVYVERRNGTIELGFADETLSLHEQLLHYLFKRDLEYNLAYELDDHEASLIFDNDYSVFYTSSGFSKFDGGIKLTKVFTPETIFEIEKVANKCNLVLVSN